MPGKSLPQVRRLSLCAALLTASFAVYAAPSSKEAASASSSPATVQKQQTPSAHTLHVAAILQQQRDLELKRLSP